MKTIDYRRLGLQRGERFLDIGCGEGRHAICAEVECGAYSVGVDLKLQNLHSTKRKRADFPDASSGKLLLLNADAQRLPFANNAFHRVICSEVLEHIDDYATVVREAARVLRRGGTLAVSVPARWPERLCWALDPTYAYAPGGHIRIFRSAQLRREIEQLTGLRCYRQEGVHALHTPYWWLRCFFYRNPEGAWSVQAWHRLLVWDLFAKPRSMRWLERLLNPILGKSRVLYFR